MGSLREGYDGDSRSESVRALSVSAGQRCAENCVCQLFWWSRREVVDHGQCRGMRVRASLCHLLTRVALMGSLREGH